MGRGGGRSGDDQRRGVERSRRGSAHGPRALGRLEGGGGVGIAAVRAAVDGSDGRRRRASPADASLLRRGILPAPAGGAPREALHALDVEPGRLPEPHVSRGVAPENHLVVGRGGVVNAHRAPARRRAVAVQVGPFEKARFETGISLYRFKGGGWAFVLDVVTPKDRPKNSRGFEPATSHLLGLGFTSCFARSRGSIGCNLYSPAEFPAKSTKVNDTLAPRTTDAVL